MNKITITTKHFFILCLFFIFNLNVFAQNNISTIKGKVLDENEAPLPYVSVAVYQDDKIITGAITNDDGVFTLKMQQSDEELRLTFDFIGYIKEEITKICLKDLKDEIKEENIDDIIKQYHIDYYHNVYGGNDYDDPFYKLFENMVLSEYDDFEVKLDRLVQIVYQELQFMII